MSEMLCSTAEKEQKNMAHDYKELDSAIMDQVVKGCVGFATLCRAVAKHSESLAATDKWPAWRIVDRRLQALRKAGRIRYQSKPEGWVPHHAKLSGAEGVRS